MAEAAHGLRRSALDRVRDLLGRLLRIPPPPEAPAGSPGSVRRFRAAPGFYRYRLVQWGLKQVGALWGLGMGLTFVNVIPEFVGSELLFIAEVVGIAGFVLQLPVTFLLVRVDFDYRWYLVTDRGLRIREGVYRVREQTMSFANVQNLSIEQGPLQRLFGISDLKVRTAGGGGGASGEASGGKDGHHRDLHLGFFRGVDDAESIRDLVLGHLRRVRDSGLGDPDDAGEPAEPALEPVRVPGAGTAVAAARQLLAEARALRADLGRGIRTGASPAP